MPFAAVDQTARPAGLERREWKSEPGRRNAGRRQRRSGEPGITEPASAADESEQPHLVDTNG